MLAFYVPLATGFFMFRGHFVVGAGVRLLFNESLIINNHTQFMDAYFRDFRALEFLWPIDRRITHRLISLFFE